MITSMMNTPLLISDILEFAEKNHPNSEIISRCVETNTLHRTNQREAAQRAKQLANALLDWGVHQGDRIATLAWNTWRHYEIYFATAGIGAICHTINPRLFLDQIDYIVNDAADRLLFVDLDLVPILESLQDRLQTLEAIIIMTDSEHMPNTTLSNVICYETFIRGRRTQIEWPVLDDMTGCSLCYTSGTTGNPKGVLYTHRSTLLHALGILHDQALNVRHDTILLPVVPLFHANCWGLPYAAAIMGTTLVFPGTALDGKSLWELIEGEGVSYLAGVPTVWLSLLNHLDDIGAKMTTVDTVAMGGSAVPLSMIQAFDEKHNAYVMQIWGMTETSPLGTVNPRTNAMMSMPKENRYQLQRKQGRPIFGVDLKIVDDNGHTLPNDGIAYGRLMVRGPWIINSYYNSGKVAAEDGWFDTGDVATIDCDNYMQIVDRSKDVIKSGGEWISSIEIENLAIAHPAIAEACVIGIPHPKWQERPLLLAVLRDGSSVTHDEIRDFLKPSLAAFALPDDIVFCQSLPHTATGKLLKSQLRKNYADHYQ